MEPSFLSAFAKTPSFPHYHRITPKDTREFLSYSWQVFLTLSDYAIWDFVETFFSGNSHDWHGGCCRVYFVANGIGLGASRYVVDRSCLCRQSLERLRYLNWKSERDLGTRWRRSHNNKMESVRLPLRAITLGTIRLVTKLYPLSHPANQRNKRTTRAIYG